MTDYNNLIERLRAEALNKAAEATSALDMYLAIESLVTELSEERHRHDRLQDFEVAQAQELARVKAELDAAVEDLKTSSSCMVCKHINTHPDCDCECLTCELECSCHECLYGSGFEWRGPQKED